MSKAEEFYERYQTFRQNWDNYTTRERSVLLREFNQEINTSIANDENSSEWMRNWSLYQLNREFYSIQERATILENFKGELNKNNSKY